MGLGGAGIFSGSRSARGISNAIGGDGVLPRIQISMDDLSVGIRNASFLNACPGDTAVHMVAEQEVSPIQPEGEGRETGGGEGRGRNAAGRKEGT